jgi:hypothetical protein
MNNNFNLKQYLSENRLLGEIEVGKGNYQLQQLFDKVIEDDRESFQEFPHIIEDPELRDNYEYTVQNAKYGTIEELAESLYGTWVALNLYNDDSDYGDFILYIIGVCKELNFKNTKDLVKALVNVNYSDPYNEEYFDQFEDDLEGLNEIEVSFMDSDRYYLTPLAEAYLSYLPNKYDDISMETGDEDIANFLSYIKTVLDSTGKDYVSYNSAYEVWHDMLYYDYDTQEYKEAVDIQFDECLRLGLLTK